MGSSKTMSDEQLADLGADLSRMHELAVSVWGRAMKMIPVKSAEYRASLQSDELKRAVVRLADHRDIVARVTLLRRDVVARRKGLRQIRLIVATDVPLALDRGLFRGHIAATHADMLARNRAQCPPHVSVS